MGGDPRIEDLIARLPNWHCWEGVGSTGWYLWRLRSSPPKVTRYPTRSDLAAELQLRVAEQDRWDQAHK
jgi:hypothetical protein